MQREAGGTARGALEREDGAARVKKLERENARLQRTIVGLGSLVAEAGMQGYIQAATPEGDQHDGKSKV